MQGIGWDAACLVLVGIVGDRFHAVAVVFGLTEEFLRDSRWTPPEPGPTPPMLTTSATACRVRSNPEPALGVGEPSCTGRDSRIRQGWRSGSKPATFGVRSATHGYYGPQPQTPAADVPIGDRAR
jgi:hypothetical protein